MNKEQMRTHATANHCYKFQGVGIGADMTALNYFKQLAPEAVLNKESCGLDVGFGGGGTLKALHDTYGMRKLYGVDIAPASFETKTCAPKCSKLYHLDVSHDALPLAEDSLDIVFCTEVIEHLSNPFFMVANVKVALKHGGYFCFSFPMPENNLGYEGGQHAHVYPGFLQRDSFERFMKQLYFQKVGRLENGASAWYVFRNYKGDGVLDVFEIVAGNYTEAQLFACLENF